MTEQEKFMAVKTAEEAKAYLGQIVFSINQEYPGFREIIGWAPRTIEIRCRADKNDNWLTWSLKRGWNGEENRVEIPVGSIRDGDGNKWVNERCLFIASDKAIEEYKERQRMLEQRLIEEQISNLKTRHDEIEDQIRKLEGKLNKEPVEVKPAVRHLDLDD